MLEFTVNYFNVLNESGLSYTIWIYQNCISEKSLNNVVKMNLIDQIYIYIYIYTTSEKPVNDQSYGVLDRYGITILYK
jgi:hypothetical protein